MNESAKWQSAKGALVTIENKKYLDFTSSIFTQNFGHHNAVVYNSVYEQFERCWHAYGFQTDVKEEYTKLFTDFIGYPNVLFFSTGAEAIEAAIKISIHNGRNCIGFNSAMHGRTLGAEALVGKRQLPRINSLDSIEMLGMTGRALMNAAIFVEGYRGYDCKPLSDDEVAIIKSCQNGRNLIVFDEIQSGFYRTNRLFTHQHYGIQPDILVLGKSIGAGFPLSAVCFRSGLKTEGLELTATHSGQPLQMAAGLGVLRYLMYGFSETRYRSNISIMNMFFEKCQVPHNHFGMVGAIQIDENKFFDYCYKNRVLVVKTGKGWIKIAPPVVIDQNDLEEGIHILEEGVALCV